ncbi:MAG: BspA family leucine-rich repeat surface protein, partial [Bacilli bacterium]|nr:BspA family leucine-rich repeat surface protein [Bacilli bacterium]
APTITRSNYDIIGFNTSASSTANNSSYNTSTKKLTLTSSNTGSTWYAVTKNTYAFEASWEANGATLSSTTTKTCYIYNTDVSCTVDAPTITRNGYTIIGFNQSPSETTNNSSYNTTTGKLTLTSSNTGTWYAITRKTEAFTANWNANGASLSSTAAKTCYIYNTDVSCTVDAPTITREGFTITGFNTTADATTNNSSYSTSTKKLTLTSSNTGNTWYAITYKTFTITYAKGTGVSSISPTTTSVSKTIRNNASSIDVTLPKINPSTNYEALGWFDGDTKVGDSEGTYAATGAITLTAKAKVLPVLKSSTSSSSNVLVGSSGIAEADVTSIVFEDNKNIPNGATNWDVSAVSNSGAVMAWVTADPNDNTKYVLHVGGDGGVIANTGASYLFDGFTNVTSINFGNNFDTTRTTNMQYMFRGNTTLTNLNLSNFDTSKVTNMQYMFSGCTGLTGITFGTGWGHSTASSNTMNQMFYNCTSLTSLDLSNFDTSNVTSMTYMFRNCTGLTGITFGSGWSSSTATSNTMSQMFYNCSSLTNLNLSSLDTSNVTSMTSMFDSCSSLTNLNLSTFDTSKVTSMSYMFNSCSSLTSITFGEGWSHSTATSNSMSQMFQNCTSLTNLNLSSLDTSNVTSMASMFDSCSSLTNLNLSTFDTSKVTSMSYMFDSCSSLTSITFGEGWSHSTATSNSMTFMFYKCSNLTSLNLTSFDTSNVTNMTAMFSNCSGLIDLDVSSFDTSNVTLMGGSSDNYGMFYNCKNLTSLNLNSFDTSSVTNMYSMFQACSNLTNLNLCIFDTSLVTKMNRMFYGTTKMQAIFVGTGWDQSGATTTGMFTASGVSSVTQLTDCVVQTSSPVIKAFDTTTNTLMGSSGIAKTSVTSIVFENNTNAPSGATPWEVSAVANTKNVMAWVTSNGSGGYILHVGGRGKVIANDDSSKIFSDFTNVTSITFNGNYDTSNVTNMTQMFTSCTSLTSLDLSDFDTTNVTSMNSMFRNCTSLTSLDLSEFDTSSVTDMYGMFAGSDMSGTQTKMMLASITGLDGFDTSEVTDMRYLFFNCGELTTIDLSSFDTSSVTKMNDMFNNVNDLTSKLTTIVFGDDFDTSSVENISCMFADNPLLTSIDLSGFDTSNVEDMSYLFNRCYGLRQLLLCSFDTSSVTNMNYMFANMTNIQSIYVGSSWDESNATTTNMFQNSNITAVTKLSYCQNLEGKSLIKKWTSDATSDFHAAAYKSSITSIEFLDEIDVPAGATSWDVSEAGDESVMAWVTADPNDNTKYALHIASDGGVIGNPDSSCIFYNFTNLISIDFNGNYDTSLANTMKRMFSNSTKITSLDVSSLDTGNVTDMYAMFSGSDASGNQTKMGLTQIIGLTEWDTSKVTDMAYMFFNCGNLTEIDLSGFNTSNVTNMASMFNAPNDFSSKLTNIIFSEDFDTSNVTNMGLMFADNPLLETLNLTSFNTSNVTNMNQMFSNNRYKLRTIYTSNSFVTTSVSDSTNMFNNDYVLVGGNGTKYNTSYLDKTYAKIDKLGQVGYFTDGSLPSIRDVTTTSTATTLTVAVDALVPDGNDEIVTYEYSIDNGSTWVFADTNTHTFTGLTKDTFYPLKVRVTTQGGKQATWQIADIDNEIPTYQALFWGDAQNSANTTTTLKNKVSGTNGTLSNFNNTTTSGYNGTGAARNIMFDGSNDFVNLGLTNYNFNKTVSLILYGRIYEYPTSNANVFSNAYGSGKAGMAINTNTHKKWAFTVHNGTAWQDIQGTTVYDTSKFYTVIATFNGANEKIYVDGILEGTTANTVLNTSAMPLVIGGYPTSSTTISAPIKLSLKEAMVYNRALEDGEIANISSTLQKKYSVKTEDLEKVTYSQTTSGSTATVTMTFPSECGSTYTCSYVKDGGSPVTVTSTSATESFTGAGTLEGTIVTPEGTSTTTYNAAVKYNITYAKGSNVSSIGATSGSCNLAAGATSCTVTLPSITANTGYSSVGWNTTSGATTGTAAGGTLTLTATGWTRYANAKANTHSISYNLNSGTHGSSHPTSATYNVASTINNPTRSGYTFNGWTISGMDSTTHYFGSTTSTATSSSGRKETSFKNLRATSGTVTFTAAWTQNKVTITSSKSTNNTDGYQSCTGSWNNSKYQYNINYNGSSVSSGKLCYAESSGGSTTGCKNYSSSGTTGYGSACFNSATSWTYYRSSGCTYAYAKAANGASASKYQC